MIYKRPVVHKNKEVGAVTVVMAMTMLGLALASTLYTAKVKMFDVRIANAEIRKNEAILSAETGLKRAMIELESVSVSNGDKNVGLTATENKFTVAYTEVPNIPNIPNAGCNSTSTSNPRVFELISVGNSRDNTGTRTLSQKVRVKPYMPDSPDSAITVAGNITVGGAFTVGANPNGGGLGVPLSVWSSESVFLGGNGATCGLEEFDGGYCSGSPYSDSTFEANDILEDTLVSTGGSFPDDLFKHTFGVSKANYQELKDQAEVLASCASLPNTGTDVTTGLFWIEGDCTVNANKTIGSADEPVIIVVEDGDITLNGGATIYGIVFAFEATNGSGGDVSMIGGSTVRGAFISDHSITNSSGTFNTRYDIEVLNNISKGTSSELSNVVLIPGSWKDF
ncbi:MAG: hypothetical protein JJW02_02615 [Pseudoalteromonas sp.]|nr:hypothetical protein [Pseudoalteromonas sp.]